MNAPHAPHAPHPALRVLLVDPSLFTAPYDAALTDALVGAGVRPLWATRPARRDEAAPIAPEHVDAFFYRWVDEAAALPRGVRALAKGVAHAWGLVRLVHRVWRDRPDVVHWQWVVLPPLDLIAMGLTRRVCPVVLTVHDTVPFNGEHVSWLQNAGFDAPIRLADGVIVHTQAAQQRLVARGLDASRIHVIAHGPLALHARPTPRAAPRDPRWTFVLFGEIKPYKGLDLVVEALGQMAPELRARCRVIVAGRARMDLAPIAQRIHALGLQGTVELRAQRQTEQQMADLFEQADCFVLAYRQIDASGVYFLVRALNKWIVATRVGIFAEDLRADVDGQLVAVGSVSELAQALAHAVQTRPRPAAPPAQASWPAIGRTTRALYERVGERVSERVGARPRRPAAAGAAAARGADPRAQDPRP